MAKEKMVKNITSREENLRSGTQMLCGRRSCVIIQVLKAV